MRLMHPLLSDPIRFTENSVPVLVAENPLAFRRLVFDLHSSSEGDGGETVLSLNYNKLECKEYLQVIMNFFALDPDGRRLSNAFQSVLLRTVKEELSVETYALNEAISDYLAALSSALQQTSSFTQQDFLPPLLKAIHFRPYVEQVQPLEQLIQYIQLHNSLLGNMCFVLINAKCFFTAEELKEFYKIATYQKWHLLLLEATDTTDRNEEEVYYIIDRDLCEIRLDKSENLY